MTPLADLHTLQERAALAESHYRLFLDVANTVIVCFTPDRRITEWNREAERVFGWTRDEAIGADVHALVGAADDLTRLHDAIQRVLGGSPIWAYQVRKRARDGSPRVLLCNLALYPAASDEAQPTIVAIAQDVTERADTEALLRESEQRFRLIAETIDDVFWMRAPGSLPLLYVSPAYATVWGRTVESLYQAPGSFLEAVHPDDRERLAARLAEHADEAWEMEYRVVRPDGSVRWVRDRGFPVRGDNGQAVLLTGAASDITELQERREEQRRTEEQLRNAQRLEPVGRLAGGVAHDFNNLLVVINGYAELALERLPDDDPLRHDLQQIREAGQRAAAMTRQLLAFSRKQVLQPRVLQLSAVVHGIEDMLRRMIGEDIGLHTVLANPCGLVWADRGQLEQVIMNLVVNARDAMPAGGTIVIETRLRGDVVDLVVSDTGCGMDEVTQAHMFEPFFTTKPVGEGTGLGLPTVYGIVQQSGGTIAIQSAPGEGTMVTVTFPIDRTHVAELECSLAQTGARGDETVLVVDDAAPVRDLAARILGCAGFTVLTAANGFEAAHLCDHYCNGIDVLVTDIVMPQMNGPELAARLKRRQPKLPVLYMSGYSGRVMAHHHLLDGGAAFIEKPFTSIELTRRVRELLDRSTRVARR
jgi:PAS domain S-box-containing protein